MIANLFDMFARVASDLLPFRVLGAYEGANTDALRSAEDFPLALSALHPLLFP